MNGNYIEGIFINSDNHNKGIGTALLNTAKQKKDKLTLSVYAKNTKARSFYLKNGFQTICENINEDTNEQEYLMLWEINNEQNKDGTA